jgi:signal transduction histidine kinase
MTWRNLRLLPLSLAGQLIALILAAIVISQLFTLWLFTDERRGALLELAGGTVVSRTAALVELLNDTPPQLHEQIRSAASSPLLYYWISEQPVLQASGTEPVDIRIQQNLQKELGENRAIRTEVGRNITVPRYHRKWPAGRNKAKAQKKPPHTRTVPLIVAMTVQLDNGQWLNMAASLNFQRSSLIRIFVTVGIMAVAVIIIIAFTVRRLTRPLRSLSTAVEQLGRGGDAEHLTEAGTPEVKNAIRAFNVMQERLTRFIQDRTAMLAAISHDLRTPITSLRIRAEFIEDEENRNKVILTLDEMQSMVEATLAFAKDEANRETTSPVDLAEFLDAIVTDYQDMKQPVSLSQPVGTAIGRTVFACRPTAMKRALRNLIDNAVRYGGDASVGFAVSADTVTITIKDNGPGIPDDKLDEVFEPFLRLETSRSEDTGGIGLGLAIARSNIHAHGGTLVLENAPEGGLAAIVRLPRGAT